MKVSIVIPIYKVEEYVERCLESVLRQTYRQLEVILVDDCTPDHSMEIAKTYIEQAPYGKDLNFVYLKHEKNRGLSAARNTGMDAATGEYVYFLDSDDEITPDCISLLVEPLKQRKYDFVMGHYEVKGDTYFPPQKVNGELLGKASIAKAYSHYDWHCMAWNKLCNIDFLKQHDLYFKEGLIHEDELWSAELACVAESMYMVDRETYLYYIRENSIKTGELEAQRLYWYKMVLKSFYEYLDKHEVWSEEVEGVERMLKDYVSAYVRGENRRDYVIYKTIHRCDVRSIALKNKAFPTLKDKILNLDKYLPTFIGFPYIKLLRQYWRMKDKIGK